MNTKRILQNFVISITLALLAMAFLDHKLALFFNEPTLLTWKLFGQKITDIGLAENYFVFSLLVFGMLYFQQKRTTLTPRLIYLKNWAANFFVGLIVSGVLVHLFKNIIGRARPHQTPNFDPFVFEQFNFSWRFQSMPSGHSQVMFTAATYFALAFPKMRWFWFSFAFLICFSRVMVHDHFLSDTIMGAFTGWLGAQLTLHMLRNKSISILDTKSK